MASAAPFKKIPLRDSKFDFPGSPYSVSVLKVGYYHPQPDGTFRADGTVTLITGAGKNILVDTGGPWDRDFLLESLQKKGLKPGDIHVVVGTHGHSDHVGNLNLFPSAVIIVGHDVNRLDVYLPNQLGKGDAYVVDEHVCVVPTPGHTGQDVSVQVKGTSVGTILVAGDLFDCCADDDTWRELSLKPDLQETSRQKALETADIIIPGHGPPFRVLNHNSTN
nr:metallo-beta-lactamase domain-containing protein 1-like [Nerophis lumbriciformis]